MLNILDTAVYHSLLEYGNLIEQLWNRLPVGEIKIDISRFIIALRSFQNGDFNHAKKIIILLKRNKEHHKLCLDKLEMLVDICYRC